VAVLRQRDGWPRDWWLIQCDGWLRQRDGWLCRGREMGVAEVQRWAAVPRQRYGWLRQRDVCHSEMDG
jgi:hypothetical protein